MRMTNWKVTAELIGIAAIVASLIFVGLQLRQDQEIAVSQIYADWDDTRIEWARLINENDEVWIRGLSGGDLNEQERLRFESLADTWFHMENGRYIRARRISLASPRDIALRDAAFLLDHPGLRRWWDVRWTYRRSMGIDNPFFESEVNQIIKDFESGSLKHIKRQSDAPM